MMIRPNYVINYIYGAPKEGYVEFQGPCHLFISPDLDRKLYDPASHKLPIDKVFQTFDRAIPPLSPVVELMDNPALYQDEDQDEIEDGHNNNKRRGMASGGSQYGQGFHYNDIETKALLHSMPLDRVFEIFIEALVFLRQNIGCVKLQRIASAMGYYDSSFDASSFAKNPNFHPRVLTTDKAPVDEKISWGAMIAELSKYTMDQIKQMQVDVRNE